jgi:multiple antibiotic resistance protein
VKFFGEVFVTLLVITDPAGTVPVFIALTRGREPQERHRLAWQAALVAFGVILAFALFGREVLTYLGVELPALQGAGGLLLLLVALELLTGKTSEPTEAECERINVAFVPLGTPLLAGPGAIVASMLFVQRIHNGAQVAAFGLALCAVIVVLLTRISGLLLSAIAVQLVAEAVRAFVKQG